MLVGDAVGKTELIACASKQKFDDHYKHTKEPSFKERNMKLILDDGWDNLKAKTKLILQDTSYSENGI